MKSDTSVEKLMGYRDQGWKFSIKKVKGKSYITIRRKGIERSLGPFSEETWRLVEEIDDRQVKETESHSNRLEASSPETKVNASEAIVGLKVVKAIKMLGLHPSGVLDFIEAVYKEAVGQELAPETFVKVAKGMHGMKVEGQKDYLALEEEIRDKRSLFESLEKKVSEYEQNSELLSRANADAERKLGVTSRLLESSDELAGRVKEAENLGLRPSQLGVIVETTRKVGARHGLPVNESINWLVKDLGENWEPKLGFENEKIRLAFELDQLNKKIKLAEDREKVTYEKIRAKEEALMGLKELKEHVSVGEIVEFKRLIVDSGFEVSTFRSEVERLGGVTASVNLVKQRGEAELAKLEGRVTTLSAQVSQLTNSKMALEAEIITLNSEAIKGIREASKTITDVAEGLKLDFEAPVTGYKARIQSLGREATEMMKEEFKTENELLKMSAVELSKSVARSASEVEGLRRNMWDVGKLVGFNVHLTRLARIVAGESVGTVEALSTMKMTVDAFIDYLSRNKLANKCPSATRFSAELRSIIT